MRLSVESPSPSPLGAGLFYLVMLAVAFSWGALRDDVNIFVYERMSGEPRPELLVRAGLGLGVGLLFVLATHLTSRFDWSRRLAAELRKRLGALDLGSVAVLAITSAVGEEALFRGAMQPAWGLGWTSLVFGLLHLGPGRAFLPWTLWAVASGFGLGWLADYTGDLLAPTLAHFTVNYFNLGRLSRGDLG